MTSDVRSRAIMVLENAMTSLEKYAQAIADTIYKYNYDGLDIDFEPNVDGVSVGKLDENDTYVRWFLDILCKHLGPQSNSGKMLVIDGELWEGSCRARRLTSTISSDRPIRFPAALRRPMPDRASRIWTRA